MSLTKLSMGGNNDVIYKLFPPRESFVSDIPAGDGKTANPFLQCRVSEKSTVIFKTILWSLKIRLDFTQAYILILAGLKMAQRSSKGRSFLLNKQTLYSRL